MSVLATSYGTPEGKESGHILPGELHWLLVAVAESRRTGMNWGHRAFGIAWLALIAVSASACPSGNGSLEGRVRATIARAETLAEAKDLSGLKTLVSDTYHDDAAHDKRAVLGLLFVQFRRHESIHLLTRIDRIDIQPPAQATVTVFAAMAGQPISTVSDLPALRADLYRFDVSLADERGVWRVTKSAWRPAVLSDFFPSETTD